MSERVTTEDEQASMQGEPAATRSEPAAAQGETAATRNEPAKTHGPVLLYDGVCGFCNRGVQLALRYDRRETLRFAALQSDYGRAALARHTELAGVDSVVYLEERDGVERAYARSEAALRVAAQLGGAWKLFLVFRLLPRFLRDFLYDLFARNRYRMFGKYDACLLPSPEVRSRFLDL